MGVKVEVNVVRTTAVFVWVRPAVVDVWVVVIFVVITVVESDEEELELVGEDELCAATGRATIASTANTASAHQRRCRHQRRETTSEPIVEDVEHDVGLLGCRGGRRGSRGRGGARLGTAPIICRSKGKM